MSNSKINLSRKSISILIAIALASSMCVALPKQAHAAVSSKATILKIDKAAKAFTVKWKPSLSTSKMGYQIRYCPNSNMKTAVKTVNVSKNAISKKISSGVMPSTTYYVQIRVAYKTSGKKKYTGWSAKKTVTTLIGSWNSTFDKKVESILSRKIKKTGSLGLKKAFRYVAALHQGPTIASSRTSNWKKWSVAYAKAMVDKGGGDCYQAASLMTWLAKGLGYKARVAYGTYIGDSGKANPHGWSEIKIGTKYYIFDANNQNTADIFGLNLNYYKISKTSGLGKKYVEIVS